MPKNSSKDAATIAASQLIHALEIPTPESPFKVEEPLLSAIKKHQKFQMCYTTTRD